MITAKTRIYLNYLQREILGCLVENQDGKYSEADMRKALKAGHHNPIFNDNPNTAKELTKLHAMGLVDCHVIEGVAYYQISPLGASVYSEIGSQAQHAR